ncbi:MAG: hypothetical protein MPJ22_00385 [Pirellulales bacterium]|nr:hypothetical protein [Alphaproteobacteria bacterium]MDA8040865.1 hypothetical protein [Pirellulales bacterium]
MSIVSTKAAGGNLRITASIASGATGGTVVPADLEWSSRIGTAKEIIIPTSEEWLLTDLFCNSATDAGVDVLPVVEFKKDNDRLLDTSQLLNVVVVTSNQRPNGLHGNLSYEGGSHMSAQILTSETAAAARSIKAIAPYEKNA